MTIDGSLNKSNAVAAITLAANSVPFQPIDVPPDATACHE